MIFFFYMCINCFLNLIQCIHACVYTNQKHALMISTVPSMETNFGFKSEIKYDENREFPIHIFLKFNSNRATDKMKVVYEFQDHISKIKAVRAKLPIIGFLGPLCTRVITVFKGSVPRGVIGPGAYKLRPPGKNHSTRTN